MKRSTGRPLEVVVEGRRCLVTQHVPVLDSCVQIEIPHTLKTPRSQMPEAEARSRSQNSISERQQLRTHCSNFQLQTLNEPLLRTRV